MIARTPHKFMALGRLPPGAMNKTEAKYADHLRVQQATGQILWWLFEGLKLRLANSTFYSPDFVVMTANGELECREVKGFMRDDANVKLKVAAERFPFRFLLVRERPKKLGGGWMEIEISCLSG